jgi:hypothetical protein
MYCVRKDAKGAENIGNDHVDTEDMRWAETSAGAFDEAD